MITINLELNDAHQSIPSIFAKIAEMKEQFNTGLYKLRIGKSLDVWNLDIFIQPRFRNKTEMNLIFGENHKFNILSDLLGAGVFLSAEVKTKFSSRSVIPEVKYTLQIPKEFNDLIIDKKIGHEVTKSDFPYLNGEKPIDIKMDETYLDFLKRQSEETQKSVFLQMVCDFTAMDCENFIKISDHNEKVAFIKDSMCLEENKEFFNYIFARTDFDLENLFKTIQANAERTIALNQILADAFVAATTSMEIQK